MHTRSAQPDHGATQSRIVDCDVAHGEARP